MGFLKIRLLNGIFNKILIQKKGTHCVPFFIFALQISVPL
jgi:hypothetical protein